MCEVRIYDLESGDYYSGDKLDASEQTSASFLNPIETSPEHYGYQLTAKPQSNNGGNSIPELFNKYAVEIENKVLFELQRELKEIQASISYPESAHYQLFYESSLKHIERIKAHIELTEIRLVYLRALVNEVIESADSSSAQLLEYFFQTTTHYEKLFNQTLTATNKGYLTQHFSSFLGHPLMQQALKTLNYLISDKDFAIEYQHRKQAIQSNSEKAGIEQETGKVTSAYSQEESHSSTLSSFVHGISKGLFSVFTATSKLVAEHPFQSTISIIALLAFYRSAQSQSFEPEVFYTAPVNNDITGFSTFQAENAIFYPFILHNNTDDTYSFNLLTRMWDNFEEKRSQERIFTTTTTISAPQYLKCGNYSSYWWLQEDSSAVAQVYSTFRFNREVAQNNLIISSQLDNNTTDVGSYTVACIGSEHESNYLLGIYKKPFNDLSYVTISQLDPLTGECLSTYKNGDSANGQSIAGTFFSEGPNYTIFHSFSYFNYSGGIYTDTGTTTLQYEVNKQSPQAIFTTNYLSGGSYPNGQQAYSRFSFTNIDNEITVGYILQDNTNGASLNSPASTQIVTYSPSTGSMKQFDPFHFNNILADFTTGRVFFGQSFNSGFMTLYNNLTAQETYIHAFDNAGNKLHSPYFTLSAPGSNSSIIKLPTTDEKKTVEYTYCTPDLQTFIKYSLYTELMITAEKKSIQASSTAGQPQDIPFTIAVHNPFYEESELLSLDITIVPEEAGVFYLNGSLPTYPTPSHIFSVTGQTEQFINQNILPHLQYLTAANNVHNQVQVNFQLSNTLGNTTSLQLTMEVPHYPAISAPFQPETLFNTPNGTDIYDFSTFQTENIIFYPIILRNYTDNTYSFNLLKREIGSLEEKISQEHIFTANTTLSAPRYLECGNYSSYWWSQLETSGLKQVHSLFKYNDEIVIDDFMVSKLTNDSNTAVKNYNVGCIGSGENTNYFFGNEENAANNYGVIRANRFNPLTGEQLFSTLLTAGTNLHGSDGLHLYPGPNNTLYHSFGEFLYSSELIYLNAGVATHKYDINDLNPHLILNVTYPSGNNYPRGQRIYNRFAFTKSNADILLGYLPQDVTGTTGLFNPTTTQLASYSLSTQTLHQADPFRFSHTIADFAFPIGNYNSYLGQSFNTGYMIIYHDYAQQKAFIQAFDNEDNELHAPYLNLAIPDNDGSAMQLPTSVDKKIVEYTYRSPDLSKIVKRPLYTELVVNAEKKSIQASPSVGQLQDIPFEIKVHVPFYDPKQLLNLQITATPAESGVFQLNETLANYTYMPSNTFSITGQTEQFINHNILPHLKYQTFDNSVQSHVQLDFHLTNTLGNSTQLQLSMPVPYSPSITIPFQPETVFSTPNGTDIHDFSTFQVENMLFYPLILRNHTDNTYSFNLLKREVNSFKEKISHETIFTMSTPILEPRYLECGNYSSYWWSQLEPNGLKQVHALFKHNNTIVRNDFMASTQTNMTNAAVERYDVACLGNEDRVNYILGNYEHNTNTIGFVRINYFNSSTGENTYSTQISDADNYYGSEGSYFMPGPNYTLYHAYSNFFRNGATFLNSGVSVVNYDLNNPNPTNLFNVTYSADDEYPLGQTIYNRFAFKKSNEDLLIGYLTQDVAEGVHISNPTTTQAAVFSPATQNIEQFNPFSFSHTIQDFIAPIGNYNTYIGQSFNNGYLVFYHQFTQNQAFLQTYANNDNKLHSPYLTLTLPDNDGSIVHLPTLFSKKVVEYTYRSTDLQKITKHSFYTELMITALQQSTPSNMTLGEPQQIPFHIQVHAPFYLPNSRLNLNISSLPNEAGQLEILNTIPNSTYYLAENGINVLNQTENFINQVLIPSLYYRTHVNNTQSDVQLFFQLSDEQGKTADLELLIPVPVQNYTWANSSITNNTIVPPANETVIPPLENLAPEFERSFQKLLVQRGTRVKHYVHAFDPNGDTLTWYFYAYAGERKPGWVTFSIINNTYSLMELSPQENAIDIGFIFKISDGQLASYALREISLVNAPIPEDKNEEEDETEQDISSAVNNLSLPAPTESTKPVSITFEGASDYLTFVPPKSPNVKVTFDVNGNLQVTGPWEEVNEYIHGADGTEKNINLTPAAEGKNIELNVTYNNGEQEITQPLKVVVPTPPQVTSFYPGADHALQRTVAKESDAVIFYRSLFNTTKTLLYNVTIANALPGSLSSCGELVSRAEYFHWLYQGCPNGELLVKAIAANTANKPEAFIKLLLNTHTPAPQEQQSNLNYLYFLFIPGVAFGVGGIGCVSLLLTCVICLGVNRKRVRELAGKFPNMPRNFFQKNNQVVHLEDFSDETTTVQVFVEAKNSTHQKDIAKENEVKEFNFSESNTTEEDVSEEKRARDNSFNTSNTTSATPPLGEIPRLYYKERSSSTASSKKFDSNSSSSDSSSPLFFQIVAHKNKLDHFLDLYHGESEPNLSP